MDREPLISICTVTYQRHGLLQLLEDRIRSQTYPLNKIQWVILDDSPEPNKYYQNKTEQNVGPNIKYIHSKENYMGKKHNGSHTHCEGEIIACIDDNNFYPPSRVKHAVEQLLNIDKEIAVHRHYQFYALKI